MIASLAHRNVRVAARATACATACATAATLVVACGGTDLGLSPTNPTTTANDCRDFLQVQSGSVPTPQPLWRKSNPSGNLPPERWQHAAAYDAAGDRLIVFGGKGASGALNDVWVLNAASTETPSWTQLAVGGSARPSARSSHAVAYDAPANRLIVYGGTDANNRILDDVWVLSNANGTGGTPVWSQLAVSGSLPAHTQTAAAYDARGNRLFIFGGVSCTSTACAPTSDAWIAVIGASTANFTRVTSPLLPRYGASAVYDSIGRRFIVFGGTTSTSLNLDPSVARNDVWALAEGSIGTVTWTNLSLGNAPPERITPGMIYDNARGRIAVFAGTDQTNIVRNDVWYVNSATTGNPWIRFDTGQPQPSARTTPVMAYSAATDRLIVFGGNSGNLNLQNDVWTLRLTPPTVKTITIVSASSSVCTGYQVVFAAVVTDSTGNAIPATVTWSSSNPGVLEVDDNGHAVARGAGSADVKACVGSVCGQAAVSVKAAPASPPPTNTTPSTLRIRTDLVGAADACNDSFNQKTSNVTAVTLMAEGGSVASGYTWTISPGSTYPAGITVDALTGILHRQSPTATLPGPGQYKFNMTVSDGSNTARGDITLFVAAGNSALDPVLQIPSNPCPIALFAQAAREEISLLTGKVGRSYAASLYVLLGGDPSSQGSVNRTLTWSAVAGLPPGLVVDQALGVVRGTPMAAGTYRLTIDVRNSAGSHALTPLGHPPTFVIVITN